MRVKTLNEIDSERARKKHTRGWHKWFAWRPVSFDGYWYWLVSVERKHTYSKWWTEWEYRPKGQIK